MDNNTLIRKIKELAKEFDKKSSADKADIIDALIVKPVDPPPGSPNG